MSFRLNRVRYYALLFGTYKMDSCATELFSQLLDYIAGIGEEGVKEDNNILRNRAYRKLSKSGLREMISVLETMRQVRNKLVHCTPEKDMLTAFNAFKDVFQKCPFETFDAGLSLFIEPGCIDTKAVYKQLYNLKAYDVFDHAKYIDI